MEINRFIHEQLAAEHRQHIAQEFQHQRFVRCTRKPQSSHPGQKVLGWTGRSLIAIGSWLEHFEQRGQHATT